MNSQFTWITIDKSDNDKNFLCIMGSLIKEPSEFSEEIKSLIDSNTSLSISGELKKSSSKSSPASNFRNKDSELNKNVIENYLQLFDYYKKITNNRPIIVDTIPRNWRTYSWYIKEDGELIRKDQEYRRSCEDSYHGFPGGNEDINDTDDDYLKDFLWQFGVTPHKLVKIRESCKGAKYHTYLIDMISQLYQIKSDESIIKESQDFHSLYDCHYRKPCIVDDKLYFDDSRDNGGCVFFSPNIGSVQVIYHEFYLAINPYENYVKNNIRNYLNNNKINRWTDFDVNDTDDAFAILMLIHSFHGIINSHTCEYYEPTEKDKSIIDSLVLSMKDWFSQLGINYKPRHLRNQ
jgi:hypothetical protein